MVVLTKGEREGRENIEINVKPLEYVKNLQIYLGSILEEDENNSNENITSQWV